MDARGDAVLQAVEHHRQDQHGDHAARQGVLPVPHELQHRVAPRLQQDEQRQEDEEHVVRDAREQGRGLPILRQGVEERLPGVQERHEQERLDDAGDLRPHHVGPELPEPVVPGDHVAVGRLEHFPAQEGRQHRQPEGQERAQAAHLGVETQTRQEPDPQERRDSAVGQGVRGDHAAQPASLHHDQDDVAGEDRREGQDRPADVLERPLAHLQELERQLVERHRQVEGGPEDDPRHGPLITEQQRRQGDAQQEDARRDDERDRQQEGHQRPDEALALLLLADVEVQAAHQPLRQPEGGQEDQDQRHLVHLVHGAELATRQVACVERQQEEGDAALQEIRPGVQRRVVEKDLQPAGRGAAHRSPRRAASVSSIRRAPSAQVKRDRT